MEGKVKNKAHPDHLGWDTTQNFNHKNKMHTKNTQTFPSSSAHAHRGRSPSVTPKPTTPTASPSQVIGFSGSSGSVGRNQRAMSPRAPTNRAKSVGGSRGSTPDPRPVVGPVLPQHKFRSLFVNDKRLFRRNQVIVPGLLHGDKPIRPDDDDPKMEWLGGKMSLASFRIALAFCKWTYDKWKGEAQGKLLYHPTTRDWKFVPLPQQTPCGLSTKEVLEDTRRAEILGEWTQKGYVLCGTLHHHCNISSFQSGTDENDEKASNGLHITVGRLGSESSDFHARFVHNHVTYDDLPFEVFIDADEKGALSLSDLPEFPEPWTTIFVDPPPRPATSRYTGYKQYYGGGWAGYWGDYDESDDLDITPNISGDSNNNADKDKTDIDEHSLVLFVRFIFQYSYLPETPNSPPEYPIDIDDTCSGMYDWKDDLEYGEREILPLFKNPASWESLKLLLDENYPDGPPLFTEKDLNGYFCPVNTSTLRSLSESSLVQTLLNTEGLDMVTTRRQQDIFDHWLKAQWHIAKIETL